LISICVSELNLFFVKEILIELFKIKAPLYVKIQFHSPREYCHNRQEIVEPAIADMIISKLLTTNEWPVDTSGAPVLMNISGIAPCAYPALSKFMIKYPQESFINASISSWDVPTPASQFKHNCFINICYECINMHACPGINLAYYRQYPQLMNIVLKHVKSHKTFNKD
jgi:hypothetical protein